jgi:hypothetical protein
MRGGGPGGGQAQQDPQQGQDRDQAAGRTPHVLGYPRTRNAIVPLTGWPSSEVTE